MANKIIVTAYFEKRYKRFEKKFHNINEDLVLFKKSLVENPKQGISLGANLYKVRVPSTDKNKGKSSSFRIVTYLITEEKNTTNIFLITIYDKSEESTIDKNVLVKIVDSIFS